MRRLGDAIVPAPARSVPAGTAAAPCPDPARAGPGAAHVGRALGRRRPLARGLACGDLLHRRGFDPGLGRNHRSCFALDVLGRRPAFLLLGLGLLLLGGGGGGGGGGGWPTSNTRSALCGSARSIFPDMWRSANSNAAWTAITAAIAPPLSRLSRSDRYIARSTRACGLALRSRNIAKDARSH